MCERKQEALTAIVESYAPHHQIEAFAEGFAAYYKQES